MAATSGFCRYTALTLLSLIVLLVPAGLLAQAKEEHLSDQAGELFLVSPFAHGYIHGYEDGFHNGNIDYQEGRRARPLKEFRDYRFGKSGYQPAFGGLEPFRNGYKAGFSAGYVDAIAGREFRGVASIRVAGLALPGDAVASLTDNGGFDRGFADGYALGLIAGNRAGIADEEFDASSQMCAPGSPETRTHSNSYCEGFTRAYALGYQDGYLSPPAERTRVAAVAGAR